MSTWTDRGAAPAAEPVEAPDDPHGDVSLDARELSAELAGGEDRATDPTSPRTPCASVTTP